ncbi:MAG: hypothetical protein COA99_06515 [Moraxellaceae bacterium]|nr:MAG: hypothetical protein COA99_06515 [Moraxellaceae bacterium]
MKIQQYLLTIFFLVIFIAGCQGDTSPMEWEKQIDFSLDLEDAFITHHGSIVDPFDNIISILNVRYDTDPSTSKLDEGNKLIAIKVDKDGNVIWNQLFDFPNGTGYPQDIISDSDGSLYICGMGFFMKINSVGELLWQRSSIDTFFNAMALVGQRVYLTGEETRIYNLEGELQVSYDVDSSRGYDTADHAIVTKNGDIIQASMSVIVRHDAEGNLLWSIAAPEDSMFAGTSQIDEEENVYVSYFLADERRPMEILDARVLKVNSKGELQWSLFIKDKRKITGGMKYGAMQIHITSTGNLTNVTSDLNDTLITHIDKDTGKVIWEKTYIDTGESKSSYLDSNDNLFMIVNQNQIRFNAYQLDSTGAKVKIHAAKAKGTDASMSVIDRHFYVTSTDYEYDRNQSEYQYSFYIGMFSTAE